MIPQYILLDEEDDAAMDAYFLALAQGHIPLIGAAPPHADDEASASSATMACGDGDGDGDERGVDPYRRRRQRRARVRRSGTHVRGGERGR